MSSNGSLIGAHCQLVVTWSHHFEISHKDKILKTANHVSQSQLIHFYYFYFAKNIVEIINDICLVGQVS